MSLTQMTWGLSRDDVEATVSPTYLEDGIFAVSPFETQDLDFVEHLVELAGRAGRATRPDLALGVCGEYGGDPASLHLFQCAGSRTNATRCAPHPGVSVMDMAAAVLPNRRAARLDIVRAVASQ